LDISAQKQKEQRQKQLEVSFYDVFSLPVRFEFFAFCQVFLPVKENAEIETGMAKRPLGPEHTVKTRFGLENRKKISKIIKDYFYLLFFLLIILWVSV
jgi:hypothetical protein